MLNSGFKLLCLLLIMLCTQLLPVSCFRRLGLAPSVLNSIKLRNLGQNRQFESDTIYSVSSGPVVKSGVAVIRYLRWVLLSK
jgi:hypothetical protein